MNGICRDDGELIFPPAPCQWLGPASLGVELLEFWLSKQPGAVFYSPPEVIRGLLQWGSRLLDHANYSRLLPQVGGGEVSNPPQYFTTQAK